MSNENAVALRVFPMERRAEDLDPTNAGVYMPVGAVPTAAIKHGRGIGICVILPAVVGPRVWHPLVVAPADIPVVPLLGKSFGAPLAILVLGDEPVAVLPHLPWPTAEVANG